MWMKYVRKYLLLKKKNVHPIDCQQKSLTACITCSFLLHVSWIRDNFLCIIWCVGHILSNQFVLFIRKSAQNIDPKVQRGLFIFAVSSACIDPMVYGKYKVIYYDIYLLECLILLIKSDLKWCIHLGKVSFCISTTWWVSLLVDQWVPEGTCSQVLRSTSVDS